MKTVLFLGILVCSMMKHNLSAQSTIDCTGHRLNSFPTPSEVDVVFRNTANVPMASRYTLLVNASNGATERYADVRGDRVPARSTGSRAFLPFRDQQSVNGRPVVAAMCQVLNVVLCPTDPPPKWPTGTYFRPFVDGCSSPAVNLTATRLALIDPPAVLGAWADSHNKNDCYDSGQIPRFFCLDHHLIVAIAGRTLKIRQETRYNDGSSNVDETSVSMDDISVVNQGAGRVTFQCRVPSEPFGLGCWQWRDGGGHATLGYILIFADQQTGDSAFSDLRKVIANQ
jgi:hypothetical protein